MNIKTLTMLAVAAAAFSASAMVGEDTPKADERVRKALTTVGLKYEVDSDGDFRLAFEMDGDRSQILFVNSNVSRYRNIEVREVWAVAAKADEDGFPKRVLAKVLEDNAMTKLGAWQVVRDKLIFRCDVGANADADTLKSVIIFVSEKADEMEKEITGKDDF